MGGSPERDVCVALARGAAGQGPVFARRSYGNTASDASDVESMGIDQTIANGR
jgi:hypothetical protein